jgi:hypothetical protein
MRLAWIAAVALSACSSSGGRVGRTIDLDSLYLDPIPGPVLTPTPELRPYDPEGLESGSALVSTKSTVPLGNKVYTPVFGR